MVLGAPVQSIHLRGLGLGPRDGVDARKHKANENTRSHRTLKGSPDVRASKLAL